MELYKNKRACISNEYDRDKIYTQLSSTVIIKKETVLPDGLLWANLPRDVLKIIVEMAWNPDTHYFLAITCKYFCRCITKEEFLLSKYKLETIDVRCLLHAKLIHKHAKILGKDKILDIKWKMRKYYKECHDGYGVGTKALETWFIVYIIIMTIMENSSEDLPSLIKYLNLEDNIQQDLSSCFLKNIGDRTLLFSITNLKIFGPIDLYHPYPGWKILSKYVEAWFNLLIIVDEVCPKEYLLDLTNIIEKLKKHISDHQNTYHSRYSYILSKLEHIYEINDLKKNICEIVMQMKKNMKLFIYKISKKFIKNIISDAEEKYIIELLDGEDYNAPFFLSANKAFAKKIADNYKLCHKVSNDAINWLNSWKNIDTKNKIILEDVASFFCSYIGWERANKLGVEDTYTCIIRKCNNLDDMIEASKTFSYRLLELVDPIVTSKYWKYHTKEQADLMLQILLKCKTDMNIMQFYENIKHIFIYPFANTVNIRDNNMNITVICYLIRYYPTYINVNDTYLKRRLERKKYKDMEDESGDSYENDNEDDDDEDICDIIMVTGFMYEYDKDFIKSFEAIYDKILRCCVNRIEICEEHAEPDTFDEDIYIVLNLLIEKTQISIKPEDLVFNCEHCTNLYQEKLSKKLSRNARGPNI